MNLTTQDAQVACFRNAAAHLEPGGCFVIEVGVPSLQRLPPGETIRAFHVSETSWGIDQFDVVTQALTSHHFEFVDGRLERVSIPFRYAWPAELDLMAQLAGMSLRERRDLTRRTHPRIRGRLSLRTPRVPVAGHVVAGRLCLKVRMRGPVSSTRG